MGRRVRHLPFSLGSGTGGATLVLFAPALRGYSDGDPMGAWQGLGAASGNTPTASGPQRPSYTRNGQGGVPEVNYGGGNYLTLASSVSAGLRPITSKTLLMVLRRSSGTSEICPFDVGNTWAFTVDTSVNFYSVNKLTIGSASYSTTKIFSLVQSGTDASGYDNGSFIGSVSGYNNSTSGADNGVGIGSVAAGGLYWIGPIAAVMAWAYDIGLAMLNRVNHSSGLTFRVPTQSV